MQLFSDDPDIESALAEFIATAFSPEEREIARLKPLLNVTPARSRLRAVIEWQMREVRLPELRGVA